MSIEHRWRQPCEALTWGYRSTPGKEKNFVGYATLAPEIDRQFEEDPDG